MALAGTGQTGARLPAPLGERDGPALPCPVPCPGTGRPAPLTATAAGGTSGELRCARRRVPSGGDGSTAPPPAAPQQPRCRLGREVGFLPAPSAPGGAGAARSAGLPRGVRPAGPRAAGLSALAPARRAAWVSRLGAVWRRRVRQSRALPKTPAGIPARCPRRARGGLDSIGWIP